MVVNGNVNVYGLLQVSRLFCCGEYIEPSQSLSGAVQNHSELTKSGLHPTSEAESFLDHKIIVPSSNDRRINVAQSLNKYFTHVFLLKSGLDSAGFQYGVCSL
jgi:hypothetical protein